jgi:hypothetical protein
VQFEFVDDFTVHGVVPSSGVAGASVVVTVIGSGFLESGMWLRIGANAAASACNVSAGRESATCELDAGHTIGRFNIYMSFDSARWIVFDVFFQTYGAFTVTSIAPSTGPMDGGWYVTLFGSSFSHFKDPTCRIASQVVDAQHVFEGLACLVGALSRSGTVSVELSGNGVQFNVVGSLFVFPSSSVLRLQPSCGSLSGGTSVFVSGGEGFSLVSGLWCRFCDALVVSAESEDSSDGGNVVICISPAQFYESRCSVEISSDRQKWLRAGWFEFRNTIRVSKISPSVGHVAGGTSVSIVANEIRSGDYAVCRFGSAQSATVVTEGGYVACVSPAANQSRIVDVAVSLNGQEWSTGTSSFRYLDPIELLWVEPQNIIAGRKQSIRVGVGNLGGWIGSVSCRFGEALVLSAFIQDDIVVCSHYIWDVPLNTTVAIILDSSLVSTPKHIQIHRPGQVGIYPVSLCQRCGNFITVTGLIFHLDHFSMMLDGVALEFGEWSDDRLVVPVPSEFQCGNYVTSCSKVLKLYRNSTLVLTQRIDILFPPKISLESLLRSSAVSGTQINLLAHPIYTRNTYFCSFNSNINVSATFLPATVVSCALSQTSFPVYFDNRRSQKHYIDFLVIAVTDSHPCACDWTWISLPWLLVSSFQRRCQDKM